MRAAVNIAHVGALAVVLGLSTFPAGVAAADATDARADTASGPVDPGSRRATGPKAPAVPRAERKRAGAPARAKPPKPARASATGDSASVPRARVAATPPAAAAGRLRVPDVLPEPALRGRTVAEVAVRPQAAGAAVRSLAGPLAGTADPAARPMPAPAATVMSAAAGTARAGGSNPLADNGTGVPVFAPVSWVLAAAARREWGFDPGGPAVAPAAVVSRGVLFNRPPVITSVAVGAGNPATGVVSAVVNARDPNNDRLTFRISSPAKGSASISPVGVLTYTPTATAMHAAARETAPAQDRSDTVTVTVTDTRFARVSRAVTIPIVPRNAVPVARTTVGTPNAATGVVTGRVSATDADGDALSYTAPAAAARGTVQVNATGDFTYTPSAAARHAAARSGATAAERSDTFTVTVRDGYGAVLRVPVTVAIAPGNSAPAAGVPVVGTPNASTGVVTGSVSATDSDGDTLSFSAPASTAKGALTLNPGTGAFSYRPTAAARDAAGASGATAADRRDGFTVTVTDGHGGSTAVAVSVPVSPTTSAVNRAPTGSATVNAPDPVSGVVTGAVVGRDADGDTLSYSAPASTPKGRVTVNAANGSFSYTPNAAARDAAAAQGATEADRRDGFTVTVADGRGGTAAVAVSVPVAPTPAAPAGLPAFPGAEGFGANATGGRGGSVVYVTNLNADGPGSLQWAIDQPGARYVLFKVSGVINTQIHLTNGNVTIAGQTSPGGITVRGFVTDESPYQDQEVRAPGDFAENWILQHIRIRPGTDSYSDDGLRLRYTRNGIVDHVSIGNATDEAIEISYSNNITVQNTLLAETLGYHAEYGGILMNYSNPAYGFGLDNVSLHHNVFNRIWGRLPEGSRESLAAANSTMNLELSNNLYWDPRFFIALGPGTGTVTNPSGNSYPIYWKINAVNNYFRTGASFPYGMFDDQILRNSANQLYLSGNKMSLYPTRSDYELFYCCNDYPALSSADVASLVSQQQAQKRSTRFPFPAITYTATDQLRTVLLNTAGAWPRDPMDTRLMQNVAANTIATAPIETNPAGDALRPVFSGSAPAAPADTDNDGMPDAWENARGLNPAVANTNATTLSSLGYTDLEIYLQELSASRINGTAL
ncbi:MAG: Ig-like domain-containing protein [Mycobacterium sp.]